MLSFVIRRLTQIETLCSSKWSELDFSLATSFKTYSKDEYGFWFEIQSKEIVNRWIQIDFFKSNPHTILFLIQHLSFVFF